MNPFIKRHIPGWAVTVVMLIVFCVFSGVLIKSQLLPGLMIALIVLGLLMVSGCILFLTWKVENKVLFIVGTVFAAILSVGLLIGGSYLERGVSAVEEIVEVTVEIADVGVYVKHDDKAQSVNDTKGYTFGILLEQDRENTDKAIAELAKTLDEEMAVVEYPGLAELVDSLITTGETQAIVINSAFIGLLPDMEGYEDAEDLLREVHIQQIETVIERVVEKPKKDNKKDNDEEKPEEEEHVFSVYISGIDSRSGLIAKSRSDVNVVATVNTQTRQILLVSTPRDFYVPLPISNGQPDKLTHAGIYGIDVSMGTLEMLYQTEIDYFFRVNFTGFEGIVDALGGITVDSPVAFSTKNFSFTEGPNEMDGKQALEFARQRKAFASGDRQRGKNQMAVIEGVIDKALSPVLLTNFEEIITGVAGSFEGSMPYEVLAGLVRQQLDEGGGWNIVSYSVDGSGASKKPYSLSTNAYVMLPDYNTVSTAIAMMEQVKNGEILTQQ